MKPIPWQWLEDMEAHATVLAEWRVACAEQLEEARPFLRPTGGRAESYRCTHRFPCSCEHRVVIHAPDRMVACCQCEDGGCEKFPLKMEDIAVWELDATKFTRALARACDCEPVRDALGIHRAHQVGVWSAARVPVVVAFPNELWPLGDMIAALFTRLRSRFVLLTPTMRFLDAVSIERLHGIQSRCFDLATNLVVGPRGDLRFVKRSGELFAEFAPIVDDSREETVARAAFRLVEQLDSEDVMKAPSVLTVFRLYCMEELSADQIAARCRCGKGTIINRLHRIRKRTGKEPNELRRFATHFNRMEEDVSDARARHIHRRILVQGGAEEETEY
ncbi:MAG TPA: hypothetical protein VK846_18345 [Candidatus Limnocylindria bacterium]|nr:hypothetical protein [Candidatus Limnocylindria bacterium]